MDLHRPTLDLLLPEPRDRDVPSPREDLTSVRAWARSRGYPIDESGDVPRTVLQTYARVHAC